jgi:hypothetical protein
MTDKQCVNEQAAAINELAKAVACLAVVVSRTPNLDADARLSVDMVFDRMQKLLEG